MKRLWSSTQLKHVWNHWRSQDFTTERGRVYLPPTVGKFLKNRSWKWHFLNTKILFWCNLRKKWQMKKNLCSHFSACNTQKLRTTHFMILAFEIRIITYFVSPAQNWSLASCPDTDTTLFSLGFCTLFRSSGRSRVNDLSQAFMN